MKVNVEELTSAVQKVRSFAETIKQPVGVMLDIQGNTLGICYSDDKKAIIEKLEVEPESDDIQGKVVVSYEKLNSIIGMCQTTNGIFTEDLYISFNTENKQMILKADSYMTVNRATGRDENGEVVYSEESKKVSEIKQIIAYNFPTDNKRIEVLSRMNYEGIFTDDLDKCDTWNRDELKALLSAVSVDKGGTIYVTSKDRSAFSVNLTYTKSIPIESSIENGFSLAVPIAKAIVDILNKVKDPEVMLYRDDKYVSIFNGTDTVGITVAVAPLNKSHFMTLASYRGKKYDACELIFSKAALMYAIKNAIDNTKDERLEMAFVEENGEMYAQMVVDNSSASVFSDFKVIMEGQSSLDFEALKELKIPISLSVLGDMVSGCTTTYVALDVSIEANMKCIRVGELLGRDDEGNKIYRALQYTIVDR